MLELRAQNPPPGSQTGNRTPVISTSFTRNVRPATVRVWLDGNDVTSNAGIAPRSVSYTPTSPLYQGQHTVRVAGTDNPGARFDRSWSFTVTNAGGQQLMINSPAPNQVVGWNFTVQGSTVGYGKVNVTVGPSGAPNGMFAGSTTAGPQGNFSLNVGLRPMPGLQYVTLKVTVTDPGNGRLYQQSLQVRTY